MSEIDVWRQAIDSRDARIAELEAQVGRLREAMKGLMKGADALDITPSLAALEMIQAYKDAEAVLKETP